MVASMNVNAAGIYDPTLGTCRYMLQGGYQAFHSLFPDLCTPQGGYVRMVSYIS